MNSFAFKGTIYLIYSPACINDNLPDIAIEVSIQDANHLPSTSNLLLEISCDGKTVGQVRLTPRDGSRNVWHADRDLTLPVADSESTVSVFVSVGTEDGELIGFIKFNGPEISNTLDKPRETPFICREGDLRMVLKFRVVIKSTKENTQEPDLVPKEGIQISPETIIEDIRCNIAPALQEVERRPDVDNMERAILELETAAGKFSEADPRLPFISSILGTFLCNRFLGLGRIEDIQAAIQRHQAAVDLTPDNHSEKARHLNNLGNTLNLRFERYGDPTDIDLMIAQHEQA
ncbi:hypothetical protein CPB86DRAFT_819836, partial [Serendipita vermifera]